MGIINLYRQDDQPFAQIPNAAIRDPNITPNAFRLLAYLMSHRDGYEINYEQIERQTTLGRYAINHAANSLIELGWLAVDRPKINGQFVSKSWTILNPLNSNESTAGDSTMEQPHMGQSTDIRRTLNKEHQVIKNTNQTLNVQNEFEQFWQIYPRKQGKADALKAFVTCQVAVDVIIAGAIRYRNDPNRLAAFTKMPATWLRAGCWDDEPLPERVLTREEKFEQIAQENRRIKNRDIEETKELFANFEEAQRRAKADPPRKCEHNRIAVICEVCVKGG